MIGTQLDAEEIQLKGGTKITGTLVSIGGETFAVKTAYGDIKVPDQKWSRITFPENPPKGADDITAGSLPPAVCLQSMRHSTVPNTGIAREVFG